MQIQIDAVEIEYHRDFLYNSTQTRKIVRKTVHSAVLEWSADAEHIRDWLDWAVEFLPVKSAKWSEETKILSRVLKGDVHRIASLSENSLIDRNISFKMVSNM
ncbi:hypothetical protein ACX818_001403 [Acinetobacter baumannii]